VSVRGFCDRLNSCTVVVSGHTLSDHFASVVAKNPNAQELVRLWASHNLDYAVILVSDASSKVTLNIHYALIVWGIALLKVFFGNADPCDLWIGVDHTRNTVVVYASLAFSNVVDNGDRLNLSLVN